MGTLSVSASSIAIIIVLGLAACTSSSGNAPARSEEVSAPPRSEEGGQTDAGQASAETGGDAETDAGLVGTPPSSCTTPPVLSVGHDIKQVSCPTQLNAIDYWTRAPSWATFDDVPVTVAIVDQYFNVTHPDLSGAFSLTWDFAKPPCSTYDASNATCVGVAPPSLVQNPNQLSSFNHGTIIAGVIAGRGAVGSGIVGVNPSAKLLGLGRDVAKDNLAALAFAIAQKVDVISMSWPLGAPPGDKDVPAFDALLAQATAQGTVVVMAAGNKQIDVDTTAIYPTRYSDVPGVIAVGSLDDAGDFYDAFSNYGPTYVDIGAPGKVVSSGGDYAGSLYSVQLGTSFSGPMVAGAASRVVQYLKKKGITYTASDVERIVVDGSKADTKLAPYFHDDRRLDLTSIWTHLEAKY